MSAERYNFFMTVIKKLSLRDFLCEFTEIVWLVGV